jgi:lipid-A-disaccharide synthase-like uncharacterized protein
VVAKTAALIVQIDYVWYGVGFVGQGFFFSRFFVQWLASERAGRSVIPLSFWYLSLLGGVTLFAYAVHLGDPVFILGQSTGAFIYLRNLYFRLHKDQETA